MSKNSPIILLTMFEDEGIIFSDVTATVDKGTQKQRKGVRNKKKYGLFSSWLENKMSFAEAVKLNSIKVKS